MANLAAAPDWSGRPRRRSAGWQVAVPVAGRGMVVAETWGAGPAVYLLHGWGGRRGQLAGLVEPLVAAGLRVVALDAPGHGESGPGILGGRRTTLPEMAGALAAVAAVTGPPYAVVSHSAGCTAAALAVRDGLPAERLVFVAPMADPMPHLHRFADVLGLGGRVRQRFLHRIAQVAGRDFAEFDLPERAASADGPLPPLLVIHDRDDRETPHAAGRAVAGTWPGARLLTTEGLSHHRILGDPEVVQAAVSFVAGSPEPAQPVGQAAEARRDLRRRVTPVADSTGNR